MKMFVAKSWCVAVLAAHLISTANSISCNQCYSTNSWFDCDNNVFSSSACPPRDTVCLSYVRRNVSDGSSKYVRMCAPEYLCSASECNEYKYLECDVHCCNVDYCNGVAENFATKGVVIPACLIIHVFLNVL